MANSKMNQTLKEIIRTREDISDYVFHFTKGSKAKRILEAIVSDRAIKDVKCNGYICFTEAPITMLPTMFDIFRKYDEPMFAPYGIGIKKNVFYNMGGRPVIYGDEQDRRMISKELLWRFVHLIPETYDYSWLRECRISLKQLELNVEDCFIIVDKQQDAKDIEQILLDLDDIEVDSQPEDGGICTEYIGHFSKFKHISMDDILELNNMTKEQINIILDKQDNQISHSLGMIWQ